MRVRLKTLLALTVATGGGLAWLGCRTVEPVVTTAAEVDPELARTAAGVLAVLVASREPVLVEQTGPDPTFRLEIAQEARRQLRRPDRNFRDDCSGFVSAVFSAVGAPMSTDERVATIWEMAVRNDAVHWELEPGIGDLVFFDDTWDRDHDGRLDDVLTHIGVVIDVEPDGTVVFAHAGLSTGRGIGRLNLADPDARHGPEGNTWNSGLRNPKPGDPPGTVYLAGALFAGFATVDPAVDWWTGIDADG